MSLQVIWFLDERSVEHAGWMCQYAFSCFFPSVNPPKAPAAIESKTRRASRRPRNLVSRYLMAVQRIVPTEAAITTMQRPRRQMLPRAEELPGILHMLLAVGDSVLYDELCFAVD